jgi:hypothetical protein
MAPMRGQQGVERGACLGRKLRELAAAADEHVGAERAGAAGIRDDGEAWPARARLLGQHFSHVEELTDGVHAQHTGASERGIQHFIAARQRAGV